MVNFTCCSLFLKLLHCWFLQSLPGRITSAWFKVSLPNIMSKTEKLATEKMYKFGKRSFHLWGKLVWIPRGMLFKQAPSMRQAVQTGCSLPWWKPSRNFPCWATTKCVFSTALRQMPTCHPTVMRNRNIKFTLQAVKIHREDERIIFAQQFFISNTT